MQDAEGSHHKKQRVHRRAGAFVQLGEPVEVFDHRRLIEKGNRSEFRAAQSILHQLEHRVAGPHQGRRGQKRFFDSLINFVAFLLWCHTLVVLLFWLWLDVGNN